MLELLTRDALEPVLEELRLAFRIRIPEKDIEGTVRAWTEALHGLTVESVQMAAKRHVQTGEHFPRVKEIRELALDFMARTNAVVERRRIEDARGCATCGATYGYYERERRKVDVIKHESGRVEYRDVLDEKGMPVWETVTSTRMEIFHDRAAHHLLEQPD